MIDKSESKNNVSWTDGFDLCFASTVGKQLDKPF